MSETSTARRAEDRSPRGRRGPVDDVVRRALAAAVLADPGVLRVEPTLATMVRAWSAVPAPEDLVRVTSDGEVVDVVVHLAVRGDEARLVAHRVRALLRQVLTEHGLVPGTVEVSVLTFEPPAVPEAPAEPTDPG